MNELDPLDLARKLDQVEIQHKVAKARAGGRPSSPVVVELDPTSFCDLACPECISGNLLNSARFKPQRLRELAHEMVESRVDAVILIGGGEPLLHPATPEVIKILRDGNIQVGLTTNGTQINRHLDLIANSIAWTRVSVDAATSQTYQLFRPPRRGNNRFETVLQGMRALAVTKLGRLGFSFLIVTRTSNQGRTIETNADEILEAAQLAKQIGCDYFEVKPEYDMMHYLKDLQRPVTRLIEGQLQALRALADKHFSILVHRNLLALTNGGSLEQLKQYTHCPVANLRTLLTPTGAYICPYFRGKSNARYGDPTVQSFDSMWNGQARDSVSKRIRPNEYCRFHCIRHESNMHLIGSEASEEHVNPRLFPEFDPFI